MRLDALGEGLEEFRELQGGFVRELWQVWDQTGLVSDAERGSVSSDVVGDQLFARQFLEEARIAGEHDAKERFSAIWDDQNIPVDRHSLAVRLLNWYRAM